MMIDNFLWGKLSAYVYIVCKGCKDIAIENCYDTQENRESLNKWAKQINEDTTWEQTGSRITRAKIMQDGKYLQIVVYAEERKTELLKELDVVMNCTLTTEDYYRRLGLLLGYRPDLVENFVKINAK